MNNLENKKSHGGFSYAVRDEQIREYMKVPIGERFRWLEEAQEFTFRVLTPERWEILQKFRRGEL